MKNLLYSALILSGVLFLNACSKDDDGGGNNTPTVGSLNCAGASVVGTPVPNTPFSGSAIVPYTAGNGIAYTAGTAIQSTGVTGLTATLSQGTLASGNGSLTFAISGTPSAAGTATFAISFGGQSCNLTLTVVNPPAHVAKWYYNRLYDSSFCCISTWRATRTLTYVPDSSGLSGELPRTWYLDLKLDNTFTEFFLDNGNYNGTYVIGGDSLRLNYSGGSAQRNRVQLLNDTALVFADRSFVYISRYPYVDVPGDTLVTRYTFLMKK